MILSVTVVPNGSYALDTVSKRLPLLEETFLIQGVTIVQTEATVWQLRQKGFPFGEAGTL
ncbi:MAG: hypothetical protein RR614_04975 [Eubacterium sp.]